MTDTPKNIPALWFDKRGSGPDHLELKLADFGGDGYIPSLSIQFIAGSQPGDLVIGEVARSMLQGGVMIGHGPLAELHRQIGAWLAAHPHCPGCADNLATYDDHERAMIPLRHAAHAFREACSAHIEDVVKNGHPATRTLQAVERCDRDLGSTALEYASKLGWSKMRKRRLNEPCTGCGVLDGTLCTGVTECMVQDKG